MTTIHVPSPDLNGDGRVTLDELVKSTWWLIAWIALGLNTLNTGVTVMAGLVFGADISKAFKYWLIFFVASVTIACLAGVVVGVWRVLRYEREERLAIEEIQRRRRFEDEDRAWRNGREATEQGTRFTQADIDLAARRYLWHYYYNGGKITRGSVPGLSKEMWDRVNRLMVKRGIRKGRNPVLVPESFDIAWGMYLDGALKNRSWVVGNGELIEKV